jgi:hypothetical protein
MPSAAAKPMAARDHSPASRGRDFMHAIGGEAVGAGSRASTRQVARAALA